MAEPPLPVSAGYSGQQDIQQRYKEQHIALRGSRIPRSTLKQHHRTIGFETPMVAESHLTGAVRPAEVHEQRTRWHRPGHFRRQQAQLRGTAAQEV